MTLGVKSINQSRTPRLNEALEGIAARTKCDPEVLRYFCAVAMNVASTAVLVTNRERPSREALAEALETLLSSVGGLRVAMGLDPELVKTALTCLELDLEEACGRAG